MKKLTAILLVAVVFCSHSQAFLRIATYNICQGKIRPGLEEVLQAMNEEEFNGMSSPLDILLLQEQSSVTTTTESIRLILNEISQTNAYQRSTINGIGQGGTMGAVYNSDKVSLIEEVAIATAGPRDVLRYCFSVNDYECNPALFYVYVCHLKASNTSSDRQTRALEAADIRNDAVSLGEDAHIILAGDLNVYYSTEPAWQTLRSEGNAQFFDPVWQEGYWQNNADYKLWHTQAPATSNSGYGELVLGGMDDRFDFQLVNSNLNDLEGLSIIPASYRTFGNNGTHSLKQAITTGSGAAPSVLQALTTASDHCPVVAEYQLPAKMQTIFTDLPENAVLCPNFNLGIEIANIAPTTHPQGADILNYSIQIDLQSLDGGQQPQVWQSIDIGSPPISGFSAQSANSFTLTGSGNISGTSDNFHYLYTELNGDGEISFLTELLTAPTPGALAALMIRETLAPNSSFAAVYSTQTNTMTRRRTQQGAISTAEIVNSISSPIWLKMKRQGQTITGFQSEDGQGWSEVLSVSIPMVQSVYIGMATASFDNKNTAVARFSSGDGYVNPVQTAAGSVLALESEIVQIPITDGLDGLAAAQIIVQSTSKGAEKTSARYYVFKTTSFFDFDGNGYFDINDLNLLLQNIGSDEAMYDLDDDGLVAQDDATILIEQIFDTVYGDFNLDGQVGLAELNTLVSNYLTSSNLWQDGDADGNGFIDYVDFAFFARGWKNFQN